MNARALSPLLLLAALGCNSSNSSAPETPETKLASDIEFTADNTVEATRAAIRGAFDMQRLAYIAASFLTTQIPEPPEVPEGGEPDPNYDPFSVELFGNAGGSAIFTWNDVDEDGLYTSGDTFSVTCDQYVRDGLTLDGTIILDGTEISGSLPLPGVWIVGATANLINLSVTVGTEETVFNLALPVRLENRLIVEVFDCTLPEDVFFGSLELKAGNRMSRFGASESVGLQFEGAVFCPALEGTLTFESDGTLGGFPFFADPTTGVLVVDGANDTRLELEMGFFTLAIHRFAKDEEGEDVLEETIQTSFFALN